MLKDSAPASSRIACLTDALSPWMSDTTAMMDVTATMLPSTVMNDRSLADQMAASAIFADSRMVFITRPGRGGWLPRLGPRPVPLVPLVVDLHGIAVRDVADRVVRPGDDLVARVHPGEHFEELVARDAHLDRDELDALFLLPHDEHALHFLACLAGFQVGQRLVRRLRTGAAAAAAAEKAATAALQ